LSVLDRQAANRRRELLVLLLEQQIGFRVWPRVRHLDIVHRRRWRAPLREMRHRAVMCDAKDERPLGAVTAKLGKGLPDREGDLLKEIVAVADRVRVARRKAKQRRSIRRQESVESLFHAYVVPSPKESLHSERRRVSTGGMAIAGNEEEPIVRQIAWDGLVLTD